MALLLFSAGCASPQTAENASTREEQVYIDLKQGFSLVIPATWKREKIPVSSPQYRSDTVQWLIPEGKGGVNRLAVKTLPLMDISTLQQRLFDALQHASETIPATPLKFKHPAGTALRIDFPEKQGKTTFLAIMGRQHSYLLSFIISDEDSQQLFPVVEKIMLNFSILPD